MDNQIKLWLCVSAKQILLGEKWRRFFALNVRFEQHWIKSICCSRCWSLLCSPHQCPRCHQTHWWCQRQFDACPTFQWLFCKPTSALCRMTTFLTFFPRIFETFFLEMVLGEFSLENQKTRLKGFLTRSVKNLKIHAKTQTTMFYTNKNCLV